MSFTFWKPGTIGPGSTLDRASEAEESVVPYAPANSYLSLQSQQEHLPIFNHRQLCLFLCNFLCITTISGSKLLYCIEKYGVVIVVGQTGCGKTTRKLTAFHVSNIRDDDQNFHNTFFRPAGRTKVMS